MPQGRVLGPVFYLLDTRDIPVIQNIKLTTFSDDSAALALGHRRRNNCQISYKNKSK